MLAEHYGFVAGASKIRFIAGVVNLAAEMPRIRAEVATIDDLVLVIVDTAAAYFPGDETNSNSQQGAYARSLRDLTFLPGKPAALVCCHPVKNAARDNLIPMGGSAFLNEVDGHPDSCGLGSSGRPPCTGSASSGGPEFNSMTFELVEAHCDTVKDDNGVLLPSVVAKPMAEAEVEAAEDRAENEENTLMRAMYGAQDASFSKLAKKLGWEKYEVQRTIHRVGRWQVRGAEKKQEIHADWIRASRNVGGLKKGPPP